MRSFLFLIFVVLLFQHSTISQDILNNPYPGFLPNYARTAGLLGRSLGNSTEKGRVRHVESLDEFSPSSRGFHLGGEIESRSLSEPSDLFSAIFNAPAAISDLFMNFIHHKDKWIMAPRLTKPRNRSRESVQVTEQDPTTTPSTTTSSPGITEPLLLPFTELGDYWNPNFRPVYARPPPPPKSYFLKKIKALVQASPETTTTTTESTTTGTLQEEVPDYAEGLTSESTPEETPAASEVETTTTTEKLYPVSARMTTLPVTDKPNPVEDMVEQAFKEAREEIKAYEQDNSVKEQSEDTVTTPATPNEMPPESGNQETDPVVQESTSPVIVAPETTGSTEGPKSTTVSESTTTLETTTIGAPIKPQRVGKTISDHQDPKTNPLSEKLSRRRFNSLLDLSLRRGSKRT